MNFWWTIWKKDKIPNVPLKCWELLKKRITKAQQTSPPRSSEPGLILQEGEDPGLPFGMAMTDSYKITESYASDPLRRGGKRLLGEGVLNWPGHAADPFLSQNWRCWGGSNEAKHTEEELVASRSSPSFPHVCSGQPCSAHGPLTSWKWICFGCSGFSSVTTPWLSSHFTETFMVWPVALTFRQSGWLFFLTSQMRLKFTSPSSVGVKWMWTGNLVRKHICWVESTLWAWHLGTC